MPWIFDPPSAGGSGGVVSGRGGYNCGTQEVSGTGETLSVAFSAGDALLNLSNPQAPVFVDTSAYYLIEAVARPTEAFTDDATKTFTLDIGVAAESVPLVLPSAWAQVDVNVSTFVLGTATPVFAIYHGHATPLDFICEIAVTKFSV